MVAKIVLAGLIVHKRRSRRAAAGDSRSGKEAERTGRVDSVPRADLGLPPALSGGPASSAHGADLASGPVHLRVDAGAPDAFAREASDGSLSSWDTARPLWDGHERSTGSQGSAAAAPPQSGKGTVSATSRGSGSSSSANVAVVRGEVQQAVAALQGALQAELHEDELQLYDVLGRGGFGTVYHGANRVRSPHGLMHGMMSRTWFRHDSVTSAVSLCTIVMFVEIRVSKLRQRRFACRRCVTRRAGFQSHMVRRNVCTHMISHVCIASSPFSPMADATLRRGCMSS